MSKEINSKALKPNEPNVNNASVDASKSDLNNKLFVNHQLNLALLKLENTAKEYVKQGINPKAKAKREKEMVDLVDNCRMSIQINCPPYMVWDAVTKTCVYPT